MANTDMVVYVIKHEREMRLRFALATKLIEVAAWLIGTGSFEVAIEGMQENEDE